MTNFMKALDRLVATPIERKLRKNGHRPPWLRRPVLSQKISLVVPCYNVGRYIDEFFASIFSQSTGLRNLEIIIVDDGSTDDTALRVKKWSSKRPGLIQYHFQENAGSAEARNAGLKHATGSWVSFPDPDDFLHHHYLDHVNRLIEQGRAHRLAMVSCNLLVFDEKSGAVRNSHSLRFRYTGETWLPIDSMNQFVQLSSATAFFRLDLIVRGGLRFDARIKPRFEDANFVNRYLARCSGQHAVFSKHPIYYYRKRADGSSQMDNSIDRPEFYTNQITYGWLGLLKDATSANGFTPHTVQRAVLYDTTGHLRIATERAHHLAALSPEQLNLFEQALVETFGFMDNEIIKRFGLSTFYEDIRVGVLNFFKNSTPDYTRAYVKEFDHNQHMVKITYFSECPSDDLIIRIDDQPAPKLFPKSTSTKLLGKDFCHQHAFWFEFRKGIASFSRPALPVIVRLNGRDQGASVNVEGLLEAFSPPAALRLSGTAREQRIYGLSDRNRQRYANAWLFMDRVDKADDNAEALYRYVATNKKNVNAFFLLSKTSPDWQRLATEGFRLIDFQSKEHLAALLNADIVLSSHGDRFIRQPFPEKGYRDLFRYQFVFLQHGVTKDDMSSWFNTMMPRILITSTASEYSSIVEPRSPYLLTEREVRLTGLARHDPLLHAAKASSKELIFIMPTWREQLTVLADGKGTRRPITAFEESEYVQRWSELINSQRFKRIAEENGRTIVFCPHPNFAASIDRFSPPDWVEAISALEVDNLRSYFARTDVLITDYSSVAFEIAYLDRPVVYYQFDRDSFFRGHIYEPGYFDYARDGFGPVTLDCDAMISAVEAAVTGAEDPAYSKRRLGTFPFRDGRCCERIYREICGISASRGEM